MSSRNNLTTQLKWNRRRVAAEKVRKAEGKRKAAEKSMKRFRLAQEIAAGDELGNPSKVLASGGGK